MDFSWLGTNYLTRGYWGDEAWTIGISRLPIAEIIKITGQDFHPPFYYFLVHYLGGLVGWGEVPIRLLSTFFFLLVPIFTYAMIIASLYWVGMPYLFRDAVSWATATDKRWRLVSLAGLTYGIATLACAALFWRGY